MKKSILLFCIAIAPLFAQGPDSNINALAGTPITLTVTVGIGTTPFTYQWHKNDQYIPGATDASYTVAKGSATDAGRYYVVVSNSFGFTISNTAVVTVTEAGVAPGTATVTATYTPAK